MTADRGIGGTGITPASTEADDRGIGGTGIVGVVTGFASICADGVEVAYDDTTPIEVDGTVADPGVLRVGQLVALDAVGPQDRLVARKVAVRHLVIGPIEAADNSAGTLTVAGQQVIIDGPTSGADHLIVGDWIAVSGLLGPAGAIHATRIDPAQAGYALVRGRLDGTPQAPRIGRLHLHPSANQTMQSGSRVTAVGRYRDGALLVDRMEPDLLASDPPAYFSGAARRYLIESYVMFGTDRVELSGGFAVPTGAATAPSQSSARAILSLRKAPDGGLSVTGIGGPGSPVVPLPAGGGFPAGQAGAPSGPVSAPLGGSGVTAPGRGTGGGAPPPGPAGGAPTIGGPAGGGPPGVMPLGGGPGGAVRR